MGLMDVLNGMANGPRGAPEPGNPASGGMSKTTMAVLAYLAYKAYKNFNGPQVAGGVPADVGARTGGTGGGIGDVLRNIFGGGQAPADVVHRGIENTVDEFDRRGEGDVARSWVGRGPNRPLSRQQLEASLGDDAIRDLQRQTGMDRDELLESLRENLPGAIDELTPDGRVPSRDEFQRRYGSRPQ